jgi:hypothetical protein
MKVEMLPRLHPRRGGKVKVGHVYTNPHGRPFYKVVVGLVPDSYRSRGTWNNVVMLHIDSLGNVVGCSNQPELYVSEHQDHVGIVKNEFTLKIEWLSEKERK